MRRLFGRAKAPAPPPPTLEQTAERLGGRADHIEKELADLDAKIQRIATEMKTNKAAAPRLRRQALQLMKRRQVLEQQAGRLDANRMMVDNMAFQRDQIETTIDTVNCMKSMTAVMKTQIQQVSVDDIDDVMMDMEDLVAETNEISNILATGTGVDGLDDGALEAELDQMLADDSLAAAPIAAPAAAAGPRAMAPPDSVGLPDDYFR